MIRTGLTDDCGNTLGEVSCVSSTPQVGIIANPASARDVRRLVAHGESVTTHDKLNRLRRVLAGLGRAGVEHVLCMADASGIASGLERLADRPSAQGWPRLEFVDQQITHTKADTTTATAAMAERGVAAIVVLGGDGTNGVVAAESEDIPLVSLSTGTNNAFPTRAESTVAGVAAGLVALHPDCRAAGTYRAKRLIVRHRDQRHVGLVDVAISHADAVGTGAVWDVDALSELFLCFAEPDAIGLSAIGGHIRPTARGTGEGLHLELGEPAMLELAPPIGPGLILPVAVRSVASLPLAIEQRPKQERGVVAIDGERLFRFGPNDLPTITLQSDGPYVVDIAEATRYAATHGLLAATPSVDATVPNQIDNDKNQQPRGNNSGTTEPAGSLHRDGEDPPVRIADPAGVSR